MAYEDLKNTILSNYGGQDNVPDDVYNALSKYKTQGQDALSDSEYSILDKAKSYIDEGKTVQGGVVFMNPTTEEKATKYAQDNPENDTYKVDALAGRSAAGNQDIVSTDPTNPLFREKVQSGLQTVREGLAYPAALVTSSLEKASQRIPVIGESTQEEKNKPWIEYFKEALNLGKKGEGVTGILSDPSNIVGAALPILKAAAPIRYAYEGLKGAGLAALSNLSTPDRQDNLGTDALIGAALGSAIGGTLTAPKYIQSTKLDEAIKTFPGDQRLRTMANKGSEIFEPIPRDEKIEILRSIQGEGNKEDWIHYYEDISDKAQKGYKTVDDIAEGYSNIEGSKIPMSELKSKLIDALKSGVGTYSNKDAERFIETRIAGFVDKYGPNGSVPVKDLGLLKSKFNEDIFDPRAAIVEGTSTKRTLAKRAGNVLEDYRENRPAFLATNTPSDKTSIQGITAQEFISSLSDSNKISLFTGLEESLQPHLKLSYNDLLKQHAPEAKGLYRRSKKLEDIFQYQLEPTGSKRQGSGWGRIFPGATQIYSKTGNAYIDPVSLYRMSQTVAPEILGRATPYVETGAHLLGNKLFSGNSKEK